MARFGIQYGDFPVQVVIKDKEQFIKLDDLIRWMKFNCERMEGTDKELMHTLTKCLVRLKNDKLQ